MQETSLFTDEELQELSNAAKLEQDNLEKENSPIFICSILVADRPYIGTQIDPDDYTQKIKEAGGMLAESSFPVGYYVYNAGKESINYSIPEYKLDVRSGFYVGRVKQLTLKPRKFAILPTEWLMILLMKLGKGPRVGNGTFKFINLSNSPKQSLLKSVVFVPNAEWREYFNSDDSPYSRNSILSIMSLLYLSGIYLLVNPAFLSKFGFIHNYICKNYSKDDKFMKAIKVSDNKKFLYRIINGRIL